jgi:hypothetical protein
MTQKEAVKIYEWYYNRIIIQDDGCYIIPQIKYIQRVAHKGVSYHLGRIALLAEEKITEEEFNSNLYTLHKCNNGRCINVDDVHLGTQSQNIQYASITGRHNRYNSKKTHCIRGHLLSGENLRFDYGGKRVCKICKYSRDKAYKQLKSV